MKRLLLRCEACGRYTLEPRCPRCGGATHSPHPPKFSLQDPYLDLRLGQEHISRLLSGDAVDQHEDPDVEARVGLRRGLKDELQGA